MGTLGGGYSYSADLNERGQVVGQSCNSAGKPRACLYSDGTMRDIGTLGAAVPTRQGMD